MLGPIEAVFSLVAWVIIAVWTLAMTLAMVPFSRRINHRLAAVWGRALVRISPARRPVVFGKENLPTSGAVCYMANHQSYSDIPILYFVRRDFKWVADMDLFRIPVFGWAMWMAGYIPIRRTDPAHSRMTLEKTKALLFKRTSVFLFPEGTRSRTGVFGRFQPGGFRLAAAAGVPIVPVVLVGTRQLLPRGSWIFRLGVTPQIHILPAVQPVADNMKSVYRQSQKLRKQMMSVYRQRLKEIR